MQKSNRFMKWRGRQHCDECVQTVPCFPNMLSSNIMKRNEQVLKLHRGWMAAGWIAVMHVWMNAMQITVITVLLYHLFLCLRGFSNLNCLGKPADFLWHYICAVEKASICMWGEWKCLEFLVTDHGPESDFWSLEILAPDEGIIDPTPIKRQQIQYCHLVV